MGEISDKLGEKIRVLEQKVVWWAKSPNRKPKHEAEFRDLETNLQFATQHLETDPPDRDAAERLYKEALGQAKSLGIL